MARRPPRTLEQVRALMKRIGHIPSAMASSQPYREENMRWKLFLDDERFPEGTNHCFTTCRSSDEAINHTKLYGPPSFMSLDHDLGGEDTSMVYLKWLSEHHYEVNFKYEIHSENVEGRKNILAFIESWQKSKELK